MIETPALSQRPARLVEKRLPVDRHGGEVALVLTVCSAMTRAGEPHHRMEASPVPSRKAPCRIAPSGYVAGFMAAPSLRRKRRPRPSSGHRPPRPPSTRRNRRTQTGGTRRWDGVMARSAGRRTRAKMRGGHHACRTLTSFVATTLPDDSRSISLITARSFRFFIDPGMRPECEQRDTRCQECVVSQVLKDDRVLYAGCQQYVPQR